MSPTPTVACVEIGGIPISVSSADPDFSELLLQRYRDFLSTSRPEFELEFETIDPHVVSDEDVRVRRNGNGWLVERGDFRATLDPHTRRGTVRQNANPYSLDSLLRILHSLILAERGGFLLHAASAICEGQAFLFSGVSGAGKTTMTRLAPSDITLLTDEISYIRPSEHHQFSIIAREPRADEHNQPFVIPSGAASLRGARGCCGVEGPLPPQRTAPAATGPYRAFGTPFAGELARPGENTSAPISALFFLEKGPSNQIEEIAPSDAIRRLMRNILFFADDAMLTEKLLATACDFISRVPIHRLTFYPDARVWDEVRRFGRGPHSADASRHGLHGDGLQEDGLQEDASAHA